MSKLKAEKVSLGKRIETGRVALDLEQKEFAKMLGISDRTLRRYENGVTVPDALTWIKIEHLLKNVFYMGTTKYGEAKWHHVLELANQIDKGNVVKILEHTHEYYVLLDRTAMVCDRMIYGRQILSSNTNIVAIHIKGGTFNRA